MMNQMLCLMFETKALLGLKLYHTKRNPLGPDYNFNVNKKGHHYLTAITNKTGVAKL